MCRESNGLHFLARRVPLHREFLFSFDTFPATCITSKRKIPKIFLTDFAAASIIRASRGFCPGVFAVCSGDL